MINNPYRRTYASLYRGVVEDNNDPAKLGRCRVRVPAVHGALDYPIDILPWARPLVLSPVNSTRGSSNIPDKGDIVWVIFEGAEKDFPVYLGGTYATNDIAVDPNIVDFYIENDDKISYNRETRVYDIQIGERHIIVTPEDIQIKGNILVEGDIEVKGKVTASVDVVAGMTSLLTHMH